jgi:hypothetical protein
LSRSLAPLRSLRGMRLAPRTLLPSAPTPVRLPSASESHAVDRVGHYWFRPPLAWLAARLSRPPHEGLPRSAVCMRSVNAPMHALPDSWAPLRSSGLRASHEPRPCDRMGHGTSLEVCAPLGARSRVELRTSGGFALPAYAAPTGFRSPMTLSSPLPALSVSFTGLAPSGLLPSEV